MSVPDNSIVVRVVQVDESWLPDRRELREARAEIERLRAAISEMASISSEAADYMNDPSGSGLLSAIRDVAFRSAEGPPQ